MVNQLQELEDRLEKSLLDKLPTDRMETDKNEQRLSLLEQQLHTLATRHHTLEGVVNDNHRQHTAQVQTLQSQMMSQMETNRAHMASMFEDQISKLEGILSKKGRFE